MRKPRKTSRRPHGRTARKFGQRGIARNRPGALSPAAKEIQLLQEQLQAGEIDPDEFEARMEELEARSRHSNVARALIARARRTNRYAARRNAAIDPADVVLLNNAIKQLSRAQDADQAVRMLRDIIDASQEMMQELGG